jgi:hypothetical protein
MRAVVAKRLRKACYGELSLRARQHYHHSRIHSMVICDPRRQAYQAMKVAYMRGEVKL